jgi:ribosomal protein S18 acetylase RimI-like enzyme
MITIRKAKEEDFNDYYRLWEQMEKYHQSKLWTPLIKKIYSRKFDTAQKLKIKKTYLKDIKRIKKTILLAEEKNQIIGFIEVGLTKTYQKLTAGAIWELAIDKKHQGKGIATQLKDEGVKWLKEKGAKRLKIEYYPKNKLAEKIYKKWGFEKDMINMVKELK